MDCSRRSFLGLMGKALAGVAVASVVPTIAEARGSQVDLPRVGKIDLSQAIIPGGNFTWNEATKYGTRIPQTEEIVNQILCSAEYMQKIREFFGNRPVNVTSWYRDPRSNREVKGASDSRHLYGDAVDFSVAGIPVEEVYKRLESYQGNKGGLARNFRKGFTHGDLRGVGARWKY